MKYGGWLRLNYVIHDKSSFMTAWSYAIRKSRPHTELFLVVLAVSLVFISDLKAQWKSETRFALYETYDNNAGEAPENEPSLGNNFYLSADAQYTLPENPTAGTLSGQFKSYNMLFYSNAGKNRTMNQLNVRYAIPLSKGFVLQPMARGEIKQYGNDKRNYRVFGTGLTAYLTTKKQWMFSTEATRTKVIFPSFRPFNNLSDMIFLTVRIPVFTRHSIHGSAFAGNHRYSKLAVSNLYHNLYMQQRDNTFGASLGPELVFKDWMAHVTYHYRAIYSNSYGSSFSFHKIEVMALAKISKGFFLKLYGSTQKRNYHDRVASADVSSTMVGVDFQSAIAELGKKFGGDFEVKLRFHWFRNQVLFSDLYYNRGVISVGIEKEI